MHSGGNKGVWGDIPPSLEALPPVRRKIWQKSAIFGNFLDICPSNTHFVSSMPPRKKKFLVPPLLMHDKVYHIAS